MWSRTVLGTVLICFAIAAPSADDLPKEWRFATTEELDLDAGGVSRIDSPNRFTRAEADFNGDGTGDIAYCLKSTIHNGEGLIVKLSDGPGYQWLVLEEFKWGQGYSNVDLGMGVDVAQPGRMETACGKGYWECEKGDLAELALANPGILYFKLESASSVFHWDSTKSEFVRVWISD